MDDKKNPAAAGTLGGEVCWVLAEIVERSAHTNEKCAAPLAEFYVYEHWRPDKEACFYVGKGRGKRARELHRAVRNRHHTNIVAKLERMGMCVEVRIVADELTEEEAFVLEVQRIAMWRASGVVLANLTDGGEGVSGYVWTEEYREKHRVAMQASHARTEVKERCRAAMKAAWARSEVKDKRRAAAIASNARPEVKEKKRASNARPEVKEKRRLAALKRFQRERAQQLGAWSPEGKEKRRAAIQEAMNRPEVIEKLRAAALLQHQRARERAQQEGATP